MSPPPTSRTPISLAAMRRSSPSRGRPPPRRLPVTSGEITTVGTDAAQASAPAREKDAGLRCTAFGLRQRTARAAYRDAGHQTVIKPKPCVGSARRVHLDDFTVDEPAGAVTCPARHARPMSPKRTVTFAALCAGCRCGSGSPAPRNGRSMSLPAQQQPCAGRGQTRTPESSVTTRPDRAWSDHRLGRHPPRAPRHTALPGRRQKPCLATQPAAAMNLPTLVNAGLTRVTAPGPGLTAGRRNRP